MALDLHPSGDMSKETYSILIVDDDDLILKAVSRQLREHDLHLASDINTGLDIIKENDIDLVITDFNMPGGDGVAMLDVVRRFFPGIRRLLMSTAPPQSIKDLTRIGLVERFVSKPFNEPLAPIMKELIDASVDANLAVSAGPESVAI